MESSVVFSVDSGEVSEEEDDLQRKEELHRLLSEQLQDDLLEDSIVSTVTSGRGEDLSTLSSPSRTPSPDVVNHAANVTLSSSISEPSHPGTYAGHVSSPLVTPVSQVASSQDVPALVDAVVQSGGVKGVQSGGVKGVEEEGWCPSTHSDGGLQRGARRDVFSGTSQSYGFREVETRGIPAVGWGEPRIDTRSSPSHDLGLRQLEVLYQARGRKIEQLTQQLSSEAEETERHTRILRHEKGILEGERDQLQGHVSELESVQQALEGEVASLKGHLTAEQTRSSALEGSRNELVAKLRASEASVESLTNQVGELASSDVLERVRTSYSSALEQSSHHHRQQVLALQQQLGAAQEHMDRQNEIISQLEEDSRELQTSYEGRLAERGQEVEALRKALQDREEAGSSPVVQQLLFAGEEVEGGDGEVGRLTGRVVELSTQAEDLQFQLSTLQTELEDERRKTAGRETSLQAQAARVCELESENRRLKCEVENVRREVGDVRREAEEGKRAALEQCRSACLQLHEDSTQRLRQTMVTERQRLVEEHSKEMATLKRELSGVRAELVVVQREYMEMCGKKEKLTQQLEEGCREWQSEQEVAVQHAVGVARAEWRRKLLAESKTSVEEALAQARQVWDERLQGEKSSSAERAQRECVREVEEAKRQCREEVEKVHLECEGQRKRWEEEAVRRASKRWEIEREEVVGEAVRKARMQWLEEREMSIQSRIDTAVISAEKLWREQHRAEECVKQEEGEEGALSLELALATERGKWYEENRRAWQKQQRSLLSTAHREWSRAQEAVTKAELERARRRWEEKQGNVVQAAVEEVVSQAKNHYESVVRRARAEWEAERERMAGEITTLEERVAVLVQESDVGGAQRGLLDVQQLKEVLHTNMAAMKKDILALVVEVQETYRAQSREEVAMAHQSTAREVEGYYLRCLHQLVNNTPLTGDQRSHDKAHDQSHDRQSHDRQSHDRQSHDRQPYDQQSHDWQPHDQQSHDQRSHDQRPLEAESNVRPERTIHMSRKQTQQPLPTKHGKPTGHGAKPSAIRLTRHPVPAKAASSRGQKSQNTPDVRKNLFGGGRVVAQKR